MSLNYAIPVLMIALLAVFQPAWSGTDSCQVIHQFESGLNAVTVKDYVPAMKVCHMIRDFSEVVTLRKFRWQEQDWVVVLKPETLQTALATAFCFESCRQASASSLPGLYGSTLNSATQLPVPLQNSGITHSMISRDQLFLTVDLCPSKKSLDYGFFQNIIAHRKSAPLAISLSGAWIRNHLTDLEWLKETERSGQLHFTWINHTNTHPYHAAAALDQDFVLSPGVNLTQEVLDAEIQFLKSGLIPTVFFRFPGLVADDAKMLELQSLGLIPLGADAWLARGQKISDGSVILVHANGNEPHGLSLFKEQMHWWSLLTDLSRLFF